MMNKAIDEWKEDDDKTRNPIIYTKYYIEGPNLSSKMTKHDTVTIFFMKISYDRDQSCVINHINTLRYALVYLFCIIVMRIITGGRNIFF
jgi:hypothetical protein